MFASGQVEVVVEPPYQSDTGCNLDYAIQSETDQRDRSSKHSGGNRGQSFEAVPNNSEVFETSAPANEMLPIRDTDSRHIAIIARG